MTISTQDAIKAGVVFHGQGRGAVVCFTTQPRASGEQVRPGAETYAHYSGGAIKYELGGLFLRLPLRIISEQNCRKHFFVKARRQKSHRNAVAAILMSFPWRNWCTAGTDTDHYRVAFTRIGKKLLDTDGNVAGFKACRDEVAKCIGIDDGSERFEWSYSQRIGAEYGVEIRIQRL